MNNLILTDCDGVCLDWEAHFHKWVNIRGHDKVNHISYDLSERYDITTQRAQELLVDFNTSAYIMSVPAFKDARSGIARLVENGFKFHAITSLGDDKQAAKLRMMNLEHLFGHEAFIELSCLSMSKSKSSMLKQYENSGKWWIEDHPDNASLGVTMGLKTILMDHPHNQKVSDPAIIRVKTWRDITNLILEERA